MNNLGSVLKDVARYGSLVWLRKGAEALSDNPAAIPMFFSLVGYELEPERETVERSAVLQNGLGTTRLNAIAIEFLTPSPSTAKGWIDISRLLPPRGELFRRATPGASGIAKNLR